MAMPPLITLEEHFFSEAITASTSSQYSEQLRHVPGLLEKLHDLGASRLRDMDAAQISVQVVSHGPGALSPGQCAAANDQLAAAVAAHSGRFAGFAVLPMADPAACVTELTRCVRKLGFVGALVDNHANGTYYDGEAYGPFWEAVQDLDVPVYLHPTWPTDAMRTALYSGNFSNSAALSIGTSGFGWHSDVAMHFLKLFASGLFDRLPRLKIIVGHMGEMLPFMLDRIVILSARWGARDRPFREVWDSNIWITTSGVWSVDPMACILRNTKIDHILYSVDYPFAKNEDGLRFMDELRKSGLVSPEEFEKIAHKNARALLRVGEPAIRIP